ncbi:conserved hypothetical protein [Leishmania major strain Friedlin]|uniref:Uncharacterized protein n=1 Tax=Leishmania major TaxID=5664 RepID=Q4QFQ8_LEIMA|nr:conserved hypothetical protein [Leishmania major strain Friedlin]CAG9571264.1 hypothetical_protein_-_conserved [Leishmania major strain Friedlin]CAJ03038.1 conserved hypothetical protein [Leishmania major strain Friedlin]|eukprot:XP_001687676.1 conserved hypothetical protein [Leishmania major strain Friedlin]
MSQRITPLTRNQLLELEALVRNLISAVTQQHAQPSATLASVEEQSWPLSASSTPTSVNHSNSGSCTKVCASTPLSNGGAGGGLCAAPSFPGTVHDAQAPQLPVAAPSDQDDDPSSYLVDGGLSDPHHRLNHPQPDPAAAAPADHAVLHGAFIDVLADPWTATTWRLYDKIEYIVWWSYRPPSCTKCGMQDAWMPSGDVEFQCAFCLSGAGTTRSNAIVEDTTAAKQDQAGMEDSGDDDDDTGGFAAVGGRPRAGKQPGSSGSGAGGGGPIDAYIFFYEWLQRIPLLGPAGPISAASAGSSGNRLDGAARPASQRAPASSSAHGAGTHAGVFPSSAGGNHRAERHGGTAASNAAGAGAGRGTGSSSSSVLLPAGESLPMVLRAAYDMGTLLTTPGLPRGTAPGLRAAALYLSLLLHRFVSLFPLFCLAGRIPASAATAGATALAAVEASQHRGPHEAAGAEAHCTDVELQWVDVELIGALLGVSVPSFFESTEVSLQHLQNVFTVAAAYGVPSVLWHPGRVPGRVETMKALKEKMEPLCPVPFAAAGVSGLCPEHTAMIVALELARRVDAQPIAVSSTSPAAAAQNAQRIGMWLDAFGLYPTRTVYRDAHSYHQYVVTAEKRQDSGDGAADGDAAQDRHLILASWEKTLTELAGMKDPQLIAAAERHTRRHDGNDDRAKRLFLTTSTSPFYKRFEWILTSPCANALLHVFAAVFRMTPMELADMALRSGIYQGPASGFIATLRTAVLRGAYDVMPLARRLSPLTSSWMCTYMALHSGDRLPLLTALRQLNDAQNSTRDRQAALTRLVQRVLRKHQAPQVYQLNFVLRVTDEVEKHFNGVYFLSSVLWQEGLAIFTCLRSGRKTITLNRYTNRMSLCYMNAKEKHVDHLSMHVVPPVVAAVETEATRLVMEMALGISTASVGDPWGNVVRSLDKCARVRRRMRVPMLASRLDALASIREHASTVTRQLQQFPSYFGGAGGQLISMGPTLLGYGDAETLLASAPPLDVQQLRRDLQWNYLCLPHVSLLAGLSEDRVVAMYASLVGLLELIHLRLVESAAAASASSTAAALSNWVEELLYVDDEEQRVQAEVDALQQGLDSAAATGWSPPAYRNSHPGTPKLSRSPKSKFLAMSASTNAPLGSASSAFAASCGGGGGSGVRHNNGRPRGFSPPLARQPYTMTPPSVAPIRSPIPRSSAATSAFTPSHNAVSTPTAHRLRTPPLGCAPNSCSGGGGGGSWRARDVCVADGLPLPDLELAESTADIAQPTSNLLLGARQQPQPLKGQRCRRRRWGDSDDDGDAVGSDDEDRGLPKAFTDGDGDGDEQQERMLKKRATEANMERQRCDDVMRLLRQALPPYWEVLLGAATDLSASLLSTSGGDNDEDEDEDEAESTTRSGRRRRASPQDRRTRRPGPTTASRPTRRGDGGSADTGKGAGALELPSEALVTHKPFSMFDAEECRRRLRRLYTFISTYERRRIALLQLAAEGKLPKMATAAAAARSPKLHNGSPLTPARATATAAGVGFSTPLRLSPPPRLVSPLLPPKPVGGDGGTTAAQRSPPHCQQVSPPIRAAAPQPRQRGEGAAGGGGSPRPSPSLSPVSSSQSSRRSPRRQHQRRSPPQQSSARLKSAQKSASGLSGSVNPSKQRSGKHTFGDVRGNGAGAAAAAVAVEDGVGDNFALPPSEVAWQESCVRAATLSRGAGVMAGKGTARRAEHVSGGGEQDRRTSPPGRWCDKPSANENGDDNDEERTSSSSSDVEREGDSHGCRQPLSLASSEDDEQQRQTPSMRVMQPQKRWRPSSDREDGDKDADEDHPRRRTESRNGDENTDEASRAEEQHRRKAKKTGRRRRRQEQTLQQHQQRKQVSSRSPLHSHEPSKDGASCSPEVRAGRGRPGSVDSVSSRIGSPGLPPRPSRAEMEVKGSPVTPSQAVPSIRARVKRSAYAAATSAAPVGDADAYDADTN